MANRPQDQQPSRRPAGPPPVESGSTGRNPGSGDEKQDGKNSGQDDYGMTGGAERHPPQPGHETGSSGTSEYGRSDYGEPHEHESNEGSSLANRDESETRQRPVPAANPESTPSGVPVRDPSKQRQQ